MPQETAGTGSASIESLISQSTASATPPSAEENQNTNEGTQPPSWSELSYNGQILSGPPTIDQFKTLLSQLENKDKMIGRQGNELGSLRERVAHLEGIKEALASSAQPANAVPEVDYEQEFLKDIPGTLKRIRQEAVDEAKKLIDQEKTQILQQQAHEQAGKKMWDSFYQSNPHLEQFRTTIVPFIRQQLAPIIDNLPPNEALEIVKEESNKKLLELKRQMGVVDSKPITKSNMTMERGGSGDTGASANNGVPKDPTLKELHESYKQAHERIINRIRPSYSSSPNK